MNKRLYIICSKSCAQARASELKDTCVIALSPFVQWSLQDHGINAKLLFEVPLTFTMSTYAHRIQQGLLRESETNPKHRWAPLSIRGVWYIFAHFQQFYERLSKELDESGATEVILTSDWDKTLVYSLTTLCQERKLRLTIDRGKFDIYRAFAPFAVSNDLKPLLCLDPKWLVKWRAKRREFQNKKVFFQPYGNMSQFSSPSVAPIVTTDISFLNRLLQKVLSYFKHAPRVLRFDRFVDPTKNFFLNPAHWQGFTDSQLKALNSALHSFYQDTSPRFLDRVAERVDLLFDNGKDKRLVLLDPYNPFSMMLSYVFKKRGGSVDYLPHGINMEDHLTFLTTPFSPQRVLAWNQGSVDEFARRGCPARAISHPYVTRAAQELKPLPKDPRDWRVFILAGVAGPLELDYFERTLIGAQKTLSKIGISKITAKIHNSHKLGLQLYSEGLQEIQARLGIIELLPPETPTFKVLQNYDMILICGCSTGTIESMIQGVPYIVYSPEGHCGIFDNLFIPEAKDDNELIQLITHYPWNAVRNAAQTFVLSVQNSPHPLEVGI